MGSHIILGLVPYSIWLATQIIPIKQVLWKILYCFHLFLFSILYFEGHKFFFFSPELIQLDSMTHIDDNLSQKFYSLMRIRLNFCLLSSDDLKTNTCLPDLSLPILSDERGS